MILTTIKYYRKLVVRTKLILKEMYKFILMTKKINTSIQNALLVELGKYVSINTTNKQSKYFYVMMFTSEEYTLQDNTKIDG